VTQWLFQAGGELGVGAPSDIHRALYYFSPFVKPNFSGSRALKEEI
jgi:hypothetical protein